mgnify:CR=1 FL=1
MSEYKPVAVDVARQIATQFDKSAVVILSYDPVHQLTHTTTYGRSAADKDAAAKLGDACASLVGDLSRRTNYEDYRTTDQAVRAEAIERLIAAADQAQCQCSITERESGHLVGCWMPALSDAIEAARKNVGAMRP